MDDFDPLRAEKAIRDLASAVPVILLSARKAINIEAWAAWLRGEIARIRSSQNTASKPHEAHHHGHHHHPAVA